MCKFVAFLPFTGNKWTVIWHENDEKKNRCSFVGLVLMKVMWRSSWLLHIQVTKWAAAHSGHKMGCCTFRSQNGLLHIQVTKCRSELGDQHSPHQGQTCDNPTALCLASWAKIQIQLWVRLMHPTGSLQRESGVFFTSYPKLAFRSTCRKKLITSGIIFSSGRS